ncbi:MAG: NifU family protein [Bdellovibrionales bacterium]|nr:NifU family protein [Bdellovibrionales bacterium]
MAHEPVTVTLEFTPNPNTLKFVVNRQFLEKGAANFTEFEKASVSPFAQKLFGIKGVAAVMIGTHFITITKTPEGDWDIIADEVPKRVEAFVLTGADYFLEEWTQHTPSVATGANAEIEMKIREVLDNEIRPAVAMDGGDITFGRYEDGIVYLHLQGACSSCPSSIATLKMGVETRLKEVVPEIKEVVQV